MIDYSFDGNIKLAYSRAHMYHKMYCERLDMELPLDDIIQEALFGLYRASLGFRPELGNKFSTYAVMYIDGEIKNYLFKKHFSVTPPRFDRILDKDQRNKAIAEYFDTISKSRSFDTYVGEDETLSRHDVIEDTRIVDAFDNIEIYEDIRKLISPHEWALIYDYYCAGMSQPEMVEKFGVSQPVISRRIKAAISRLRENLVA